MTPFIAEIAQSRQALRTSTLRERLHAVREFRHRLVERVEAIAEAVREDIQRNVDELVGTDFLPTAAAAKFLEREAASILAPRRVRGRPTWLLGCRDVVHRQPRGAVGIIGTWNYPIFLNAVPILQAVAAGNAVLWKPSEHTPRTSVLLTQLFRDAGFPEGLIQTLPATREAGPQLAEADIDFLHFTGSELVGRKLAARLGERLIPSTLELSGCDAMIVRADADLELAAKLAWYGATLNAGQTCMAVRRVYVAKERYEAFAERMRTLVLEANPVRLLLDSSAVQLRDISEDARAHGCEVLAAPVENLVPPLLILNPQNMPNLRANRESIFAPLLVVNSYADDDELPARLAESPYRLTASILSADTAFAQKLAAKLPSGSVVINDVIVPTAHPGTPFGGRGASGWGVSQGAEGLLEFTVLQVVTVRKGLFRPHANPTSRSSDVTRGLLRATHARSWRERLGGFRQMLSGMRNGRATGM